MFTVSCNLRTVPDGNQTHAFQINSLTIVLPPTARNDNRQANRTSPAFSRLAIMLSGNDVQNAALQAAELDISSAGSTTMGIHKPFEPEDHDLDPTFRLTKFSEIKTRGTKVQQDVLSNLLKGLKLGNQATSNLANTEPVASATSDHQNVIMSKSGQLSIGFKKDHKRIEIGSDSCILPLKNTNLSLIETTNTVYMLVDDPYVMGKIACSNVLSNLYALGITRCDNMLMMLNISYKMTDKERDTVVPIMIRGFRVSFFGQPSACCNSLAVIQMIHN